MILRLLIIIFAAANLCVPCCSRAATTDEGQLRQRFYKDGPAGWYRLRDATQKVEGSGTYQMRSLSGKRPPVPNEHWVFKRNNASIVFRNTVKKGDTEVPLGAGGENSSYAFTLDPAPVNSGAKWIVKAIGTGKPSNPKVIASTTGFLRYLTAPYSLYDIPLFDLIKDSKFGLLSLTEESTRSAGYVRAEFSYPFFIDPRHGLRAEVGKGWVILNPTRDWEVEEFHVDLQLKPPGKKQSVQATAVTNVRYDPERFRLPRSVSYTLIDPKSKDGTIAEVTFDFIAEREVPEAEFKLTAFDLPEVDPSTFQQTKPQQSGLTRHRSLSRFFLSAASGLAIVLFLILLRRRLKKTRAG